MRPSLVVLLALAPACGPPAAQPPRAPAADTAWIQSPKLDQDVQELVLRAYDEDLLFPFRVRRAGEERVERVRPAGLAGVVADPAVESVRCETPAPAAPPDEAWREKVDPDVRLVAATNGTCFTAVTITFARDATADDRAALEALGFVVKGFDGRSAIGFAPVRAVAAIAALELVRRVD